MTKEELFSQLDSIEDNARSFLPNDDEEAESIWEKDIECVNECKEIHTLLYNAIMYMEEDLSVDHAVADSDVKEMIADYLGTSVERLEELKLFSMKGDLEE